MVEEFRQYSVSNIALKLSTYYSVI